MERDITSCDEWKREEDGRRRSVAGHSRCDQSAQCEKYNLM